jgi:hypothetical protein
MDRPKEQAEESAQCQEDMFPAKGCHGVHGATLTNLEKDCLPACAGIRKKKGVKRMHEQTEELVVLDKGFDAGPEVTCCTASYSFLI